MSDNNITIEMIDGALSNSFEVIVTEGADQVIEVTPKENLIEVTVDSTNLVFSSGVRSWNGRTLDVLPEYGDYPTDLIPNTSSVLGVTLNDALEALQNASGDVQSVFGRVGIVAAQLGDYSASLVTNDSGVSGSTVAEALDNINGQLLNPNNFVNQFTTGAQQVSGRFSVLTPDITNLSDAVNVKFLVGNVVFNGDLSAINVSTFINDVGYLTEDDLPSPLVSSVAGKTGDVTLVKSDITDFLESDYATAAQGSLADSAIQSGYNVSLLNNDVGYITASDIPNFPVLSVNGKTGVVVVDKVDVGLGNVDNTSDADKPVSSATQSQLNLKLSLGDNVSELINDAGYITLGDIPSAPVDSVNGQTGVVTITKASVGLSNVDNTSDLDKPISNATQTGLDSKLEAGDNVSDLNNDAGYITANDLPSGGLTYKGTWDADQNIPDLSSLTPENGDFYEVSVAGNTPLGGETDWKVKDWAIYSDTLGWDKLDNTSDVTSVNGQTGAVVLEKSDIGLSEVDNTSDLAKPVSNATQTALDGKLGDGDDLSRLNNDSGFITLADIPADSITSVNGKTGVVVINKSDVGLSNVDNTSDADKPISTLTQAALDSKLGAGDNISGLINDAGYITLGDVPAAPVTSVAGKTGLVTLVKADITDFSDGDYATAAQGLLANSALQSGDNISELVNDAAYITLGDIPSDLVTSVNGQQGVVVLDAGDIDMANSAQTVQNKIVNMQNEIDQNTADVSDLQSNKIDKPVTSGFEGDLITQTSTTGQFDTRTPNGGVYKLVDVIPAGTTMNNNATLDVQITSGESFSTSTDFPRNIKNLYPNQDPQNNPQTFLDEIYDSTTDRWLENPVVGQVNLWRITLFYTRGSTQANREVIVRLTNPDTGFEIFKANILPNGNQFQTSTATFELTTIADSASVGAGYEMQIQTVQAAITINDFQVVRTSLEKL